MCKWQGVKNYLCDSWSLPRCYPVSELVESTRMPHIHFDCIAMHLHVLTWLYNIKDIWRAPAWQRLMQLMLLRKLGWEFLHKGNASILRTSWFPAQQWHSTSDLKCIPPDVKDLVPNVVLKRRTSEFSPMHGEYMSSQNCVGTTT
jgi:hypothetical protein